MKPHVCEGDNCSLCPACYKTSGRDVCAYTCAHDNGYEKAPEPEPDVIGKMSDVMEMYGDPSNPDPLHPDLVPHIREGSFGPTLHHPFCIYPGYIPLLNRVINKQYEAKQRHIARAITERRWHTYLMLHERPYRHDAFRYIAEQVTDAEEYWGLFHSLWTDTENPYQWIEDVREFVYDPRFHDERHLLMEDNERAAFDALPDPVVIYRGYNVPKGTKMGWSWTTDPERAAWFARRFAERRGSGRVAKGRVQKSNVIGLILSRNEDEILVDPAHVKVTSQRWVT